MIAIRSITVRKALHAGVSLASLATFVACVVLAGPASGTDLAGERLAAAADGTLHLRLEAAPPKGREIFRVNCSPCHGPEAKGAIGPDLTDATWIHGGRHEDLLRTIRGGVDGTPMPSWSDILRPGDLHAVAAYIASLGPPAPRRED